MDTTKFDEFFSPSLCKSRVHIIGCGATGSTLAESLARTGITAITLYDFDHVTEHNIANQVYTSKDLGRLKVDALRDYLLAINPDMSQGLATCADGYISQCLSGYVFLCVDNIDTRKQIVACNKFNQSLKLILDIRMRLTDAQIYACIASRVGDIEYLESTMNFTQEDAQHDTPKSACNLTLSICPTVRLASGFATSLFIKFLKGESIPKMLLFDSFYLTFNVF